jgi:hypothetical protein
MAARSPVSAWPVLLFAVPHAQHNFGLRPAKAARVGDRLPVDHAERTRVRDDGRLAIDRRDDLGIVRLLFGAHACRLGKIVGRGAGDASAKAGST